MEWASANHAVRRDSKFIERGRNCQHNRLGLTSNRMALFKSTLPFVILLLLLFAGHKVLAQDYYLFTSFRGNGEDGLHLMLSTNGYHWHALKNDGSFLKPQIGGKLMRDPCVAIGPDGIFHMVWTSGWTTEKGKVIGYAESKDLQHWSEQRAIELMQNEPGTRNIWAPEIFYDSNQKRWLIYWSSTVPGKFPQSDASGDDRYNHRAYFATTINFTQISESRLLYNPRFNMIDGTIFQSGPQFYFFFKDERKQPVKKNLRYAIASQPEGPYGQPSEPFTGDWVEGPSAIKIGDEYLVYFDHYAQPQYYGAVRSKDLKTWEDCSKEMSFPKGHRHGTVLRVSKEIAQKLGAN
jgi:Glycosyl hydrolases family 43